MKICGNGTVFGWGPIIALMLIGGIGIQTVYVHHVTFPTFQGFLIMCAWSCVVVIIITSLLASIYIGPGYVKFKWEPKDPKDQVKLQRCRQCDSYKAPRSHHCKDCGRCVKMLDHHCPWINNCVGNDNKAFFLAFTTSVPIGCTYSAYVLFRFLYTYWPLLVRSRRHPITKEYVDSLPQVVLNNAAMFNVYTFLFTLMAGAFALGVTIAVAVLGGVQWRSAFTNKTGIESWIITKAERRPRETPFVFPFDLGWKGNLMATLNMSLFGDGIYWPVKEGCSVFDITMEQLAQKALKRKKRQSFITKMAPGAMGYKAGFWVCLQQPWESHIKIKEGDTIQAWRMSKHWFYGELVRRCSWHIEVWKSNPCTSPLVLGGRSEGWDLSNQYAFEERLVPKEMC
eukprot:m.90872 g.90872  ORF g.90872 m.90872 type:complete len:397 (+) comp14885_c0_seq1:56-1246(+)